MATPKELFHKLTKKRRNDVQVLMDWEYRGIWETAIKKYSDTAHFVYELLQNADDSKATWVEFLLTSEELWFKHNGAVQFSVSDIDTAQEDSLLGSLGHINSITAIGNSTKIDEHKIGKFGIGFKAVFAYTMSPEIHDDSFSFRLEDYIVPIEIDRLVDWRKQGETVFRFPFDHEAKPKDQAYLEIEEKLESLFHPTLFLSNLKKITWESEANHGQYTKQALKSDFYGSVTAQLVQLTSLKNQNRTVEHLWLFSRGIDDPEKRSSHHVYVGYFIDQNHQIETGNQPKAFCFFPTKVATELGFIIQAPFLLTDSREGIRTGVEWNTLLIDQTAVLAAESLSILRSIGEADHSYLLSDTILEVVPYDKYLYPDENNNSEVSFRPFYTQIEKAFRSKPLLPGRNGKYYDSSHAYWVSDPDLAELYSDEQISALMGNPGSGLVFTSKGQKQLQQANRPLESYIKLLVIDVVDPKKLLSRITAKFIESQTDDWLLKFYSYLSGRRFLWDDRDKLALKRPILLNQHRRAVNPYNDDLSSPSIFLPTDRQTNYHTLYEPLAQNPDALDFFKILGIGTPDLRSEIYSIIIPQYDEDFDYDDTNKVISHFDAFLSYYDSCPSSSRGEFLGRLTNIRFVAARRIDDPYKLHFCTPGQVYLPDDRLSSYLRNCPNVLVLDDDFYSDFMLSGRRDACLSFLRDLGCNIRPRLIHNTYQASHEIKERFGLEKHEVSRKYASSQSIKDIILESLEDVLNHLDLETSILIWDYLIEICNGKESNEIADGFMGTYIYVPVRRTRYAYIKFESTLTSILKNDKWLFDKNGERKSVDEIQLDSLNHNYNTKTEQAGQFLKYLGISSVSDDLELTDEQLSAYLLGKKLLDQGITDNELQEALALIKSKKTTTIQAQAAPEQAKDKYDDMLEETLDRLKRGIKNKRNLSAEPSEDQYIEASTPVDEPNQDQDDYILPSVDLQKKIDKLKEQTESQIEDLSRIEGLNKIVEEAGEYSYAWFKALIELEYLSSSESNSNGREISIQFTRAELEPGTERTLILKHPSRYIPQSIEEIGDLQVRIYQGDESKTVTVEVVSVKEYTLRAKLKSSADISDIDLTKVNRVVIDVKNPIFILDELRKAFNLLDLADEYNLHANLTEQVQFIFGPPGTGKTTYLASDVIIPLMKQSDDIKVLVLAPTNKAADVLTRRIVDQMGDDESYYDWLFRFGNTGDESLESDMLVVDKSFDIRKRPKNTTITTVARFAYDYFQPDAYGERLHLKHLQWDYIIIDEASMVNLASIAFILYQKTDAKFVIAGDPFQIQPITMVEYWRDMNIYTMVELNKFREPTTSPHNYEVVNLTTQYRAVPAIGSLFSHFTYDGILRHSRNGLDQKPLNIDGLDIRDINIIKFPVTRYESIYKPSTLNKSNYQVYSALFAVEFVKLLASQIQANHKDSFRIGVICPYKAQSSLVEKLLAQQFNDTEKVQVLVGTIHGFQGDECDIVISIFNTPLSISRNPNMFLNKQNILNVSISRARDYLFILMPNDAAQGIEDLYRIKRLNHLIKQHARNNYSEYDSNHIERILFGSDTFIYDNSFSTSHQSVNVYSKPEKKYEIRCEEVAIDVQINTDL